MLGFTGTYEGVAVSVQGSGMGMPSASIYYHELLADYGATSLIRVGSCGALTEDLQLRDVLAASASSTDSAMNRVRFDGLVDYAPVAASSCCVPRSTWRRPWGCRCMSARSSRPTRSTPTGRTCSTSSRRTACWRSRWSPPRSTRLAARFRARALTLLTVSDHIKTGAHTTAQEREQTFAQMVEVALATVIAGGSDR